MELFFDTEFAGLQLPTSLISIGIVDTNGRKFYAEFIDYPSYLINDWIRDNVISKLYYRNDKTPEYDNMTYIVGKSDVIKLSLLKWLSKYDYVDWFSDCSHYDFVLLIDLLYGNALNIPKNHSKYCHDLCYYLENYYREYTGNITEKVFDANRELLVRIDEDNKHNALHDAIVIKAIYDKIKEK